MREASSLEFRTGRLGSGRLLSPESVTSRGLLQPRTPFCLPHPPGLAPKSLWESTSPEHGLQAPRFGKALCPTCWWRFAWEGPQETCLREPGPGFRAEMVEGGAQSPGCGEQIDPLY